MKTDVQANRLWHMRQLVKSVGGVNEAARIMGKKNSYITQVAGPNPVRAIGDKFAKQVEEAFHLTPGSLDFDPPATNKEDKLIDEIAATLANASESDREFVLSIAQWVTKRSLTGAPPSGKIKAENV